MSLLTFLDLVLVLVVVEIGLLTTMMLLLIWSLVTEPGRRVSGRFTVITVLILCVAMVLARGHIMGVVPANGWITVGGLVGLCAFVATVTWELSDTKVYENWFVTFAKQATQSLLIPFLSFAWITYHLIYTPLMSDEAHNGVIPVLVSGGVVLPVSVAYTMLWRLLPNWVSQIGVVMTFTSVLSTVIIVNSGSVIGMWISLAGTVIMVCVSIYMVFTNGFSNWMSQAPTPKSGSIFSVSVLSTLLTILPLVSIVAAKSTPSWLTVLILVGAIYGSSSLMIETLRVVYREDGVYKTRMEELQRVEYIDPLTKVANRHGFQMALSQALYMAGDGLVAVYHLNLGGFRAVNDALGSQLGDEVLTIVSERLRNQIRQDDVIARLGGDEFAVMMCACPDEPTALTLADNLHTAVNQPIELGIGWRVSLDTAIGVVLADSQDSMTDVMRFADAALHRAQSDTQNHIAMLGVEDLRASVAAFANDQRLRNAFLQGQFTLAVQPVIDLSDGATVGFEALTRWPGATLGPAEFIPLIEENGLADAFGRWVLDTATEWAAAQGCEIAINVSPRHMHSPNFVSDVLSALETSGLPGELLLLEITERSAMPDIERTNEVLNALRVKGIRVAVDDFGTGEFSLEQLMEYPLDVLKIDRLFVSGVNEHEADLALVKGLVHAANGLGFTTIAEGIEDQAVASRLTELGCTQAQGYYWSAPMSLEKGAKWWAEHKRT